VKTLPHAEATTHVTFSLFPSEILSIRKSAGIFGSIGRAIQVAVEALYDRVVRDKKEGLIDIDEGGPPPEVDDAFYENRKTYQQKQTELKAPMSCDLVPRTARLIGVLAKPRYYGSRYRVLSAIGYWLALAQADEQKARLRERLEQEELKLDPGIRKSRKKLRRAYL